MAPQSCITAQLIIESFSKFAHLVTSALVSSRTSFPRPYKQKKTRRFRCFYEEFFMRRRMFTAPSTHWSKDTQRSPLTGDLFFFIFFYFFVIFFSANEQYVGAGRNGRLITASTPLKSIVFGLLKVY